MSGDLRLILVSSFSDACQDVEYKLLKLQSQNDALQKNFDVQENKLQYYRQLKLQSSQMEDHLSSIRGSLQILDKQCKGTEAKNKLKRFKEWFSKESNRNKKIFEQLLSRSSFGSSLLSDQVQKREAEQVFPTNEKLNSEQTFQIQQSKEDLDSLLNPEWENQLLKQNKEDLDTIDQNSQNLKICLDNIKNEITNQDQNLDIILDDGLKTKENIVEASKELTEANALSKGSKKWYYLLLLVVLMMVIVLILYFFNYQ